MWQINFFYLYPTLLLLLEKISPKIMDFFVFPINEIRPDLYFVPKFLVETLYLYYASCNDFSTKKIATLRRE